MNLPEKLIYLDHAATTNLSKEVLEKMLPYYTQYFGNASSIYSIGRLGKRAIEEAREKVAKALDAKMKEIYFTSSGTEANNWAIKGVMEANKQKGRHLITSLIEHPAVLEPCKFLEEQGFDVTYLSVDEFGRISIEELKEAIRDDTVLVSIMFANNEIGTIQPVKEIGEITRDRGVYFHTDAVQAIGNIPVSVTDLNIDLLSLSAHKFYGPKGVGALYIRKGVKFSKFLHGGHQERGFRASTQNVAGIVGLGEAIEFASQNLEKNRLKLLNLREKLYNEIIETIPSSKLNGHPKERLPGNLNFSFPFVDGESLLLMLDMKGVCASSGSACTSGSLDASHVLLAIGHSERMAKSSLRISLGQMNTMEDAKVFLEVLRPIVQKLQEETSEEP